MRWEFTLWGQPPSWNKMYTMATGHGRRGPYKTLVKRPQVVKYQEDAVKIIRSARPSHWEPEGHYIRVFFSFYLAKPIDCDNCMKVIHDAIQMATGINDERYLPCVTVKQTGLPKNQARVDVVVLDSVSQDLAGSSTPPAN